MLITFSQSGSLFNVDFQFDSFNQGDNNTHIVDVAVLDESFSNYEYSAYIQFIREGDKLPSDKFIMANKRILIDGVAYNGYTFKMASDWFTAVAGVLKATIEIKKFSNGVMESNKAYGIVNIPVQASVSAISEVDSKITDEEYTSLIEQINTKLNSYNYDFKNLGQFANEKAFAQTCESDYYNSSMQSKNFAYKGYIVDGANNQYTAFGLVGHRNSAGMNFDSMVVTQKGITCYQQGYEVAIQMPKVEVSDLKVNMTTSVPYPTSNESAVNLYYLNSNYYTKNDVNSNSTLLENNLVYQINQSVTTSKNYTDLKHNELKSVLDTILKDAPTAYDTLKEIADYIASDKTGASEMLSKINNNTSEINVIKQGLPTTVDIVIRSVVSPDTTEEAQEMELNGKKFKFTSSSSVELYEHTLNVGLGGSEGTYFIKFLSTSPTQLIDESSYAGDVMALIMDESNCKLKLDFYDGFGNIGWHIVTNNHNGNYTFEGYRVNPDYFEQYGFELWADDEIFLENYSIRKI